ncbi:MAG: hypothetical protein Hyperionvirus5_77 [Hyperionvirus sp.]|uniref:Uncharacterized protein n=1 Tax=Hyperionvirus sp. TaxID=2487770 RepID=A0A3G5AAP0_9VIRU|nr:MAG: hypothetical protein Hyperionvirus5_77 [Hyperionvirus sp.]
MTSSCPTCTFIIRRLPQEIGACSECKEMIGVAEYKYCGGCAEKLNKCDLCGNDFKPCREYLADLKSRFDRNIIFWTEKANADVVAGFKKQYEIIQKFFDNDKPASETTKITLECYLYMRTN